VASAPTDGSLRAATKTGRPRPAPEIAGEAAEAVAEAPGSARRAKGAAGRPVAAANEGDDTRPASPGRARAGAVARNGMPPDASETGSAVADSARVAERESIIPSPGAAPEPVRAAVGPLGTAGRG